MDSGGFVPLAFFAVVVLIVAITSLTRLRDQEMQVRQRLYMEELEHERRMKQLTLELGSVQHELSLSVAQSISLSVKG